MNPDVTATISQTTNVTTSSCGDKTERSSKSQKPEDNQHGVDFKDIVSIPGYVEG